MKIHESAENYLETILVLGFGGAGVHSVEVAAELGVTKPSVSVAMKNLREGGYITMDGELHITLTDTGREIAERMYERHVFLTTWLKTLGVPEETAARDACRMEHVISAESFAAIKEFAKNIPAR
ncbi:MAG: metal-dependent transcriptional regulator [Oscillospiraceae bacterium]|jgi:Mn-dependent DtxR family transcriptional regulator|nr:metal-dependent transcriptional regulator [Oscillospiraceae bacterium]